MKYYRKLIRYFDRLDADYFTGMDFFRTGNYKEAIKKLLYVTKKLPEFRKAQIFLAVALKRSGDYISAYGVYYSALKKSLLILSHTIIMESFLNSVVLFRKQKIYIRRV